MNLRYLRCVLAAVCAALVLVPSALAGGAAGNGYGGNGGNVQNEVGSGNAGETKSGSLPFTGLDLALLVLGGATLVVVGAGLRRTSKRST
jgi:hypothetical protein